MYDPKTAVLATKLSAGTGLAVLPHTGAFGVAWFVVVGFTLVMAGIAVLQLVPRKQS
jgi:LPXTG-motif cell wall-anchored protein